VRRARDLPGTQDGTEPKRGAVACSAQVWIAGLCSPLNSQDAPRCPYLLDQAPRGGPRDRTDNHFIQHYPCDFEIPDSLHLVSNLCNEINELNAIIPNIKIVVDIEHHPNIANIAEMAYKHAKIKVWDSFFIWNFMISKPVGLIVCHAFVINIFVNFRICNSR
jgi:hypothetical protein